MRELDLKFGDALFRLAKVDAATAMRQGFRGVAGFDVRQRVAEIVVTGGREERARPPCLRLLCVVTASGCASTGNTD